MPFTLNRYHMVIRILPTAIPRKLFRNIKPYQPNPTDTECRDSLFDADVLCQMVEMLLNFMRGSHLAGWQQRNAPSPWNMMCEEWECVCVWVFLTHAYMKPLSSSVCLFNRIGFITFTIHPKNRMIYVLGYQFSSLHRVWWRWVVQCVRVSSITSRSDWGFQLNEQLLGEGY